MQVKKKKLIGSEFHSERLQISLICWLPPQLSIWSLYSVSYVLYSSMRGGYQPVISLFNESSCNLEDLGENLPKKKTLSNEKQLKAVVVLL